jgi:tetratricopeptide (TPR) repeat protein/transcriptional regulator with XRE-family HTH domain
MVRRYRRDAELTQEALAERAGLSVRSIRGIESGTKYRPRQDTVRLLLEALRVPVPDRAAFCTAACQDAETAEQTGLQRDQPDPAVGALPIGRFLGSLPPGRLVARDGELGEVLRAVDSAVTGEGRLVLLSGEAGVGKTRVAQEAMLALINRGAFIGTGRCYEPEQSVPYFAFLDALGDLLRAAPLEMRREMPRQWPYMSRLFPDKIRLTGLLESGGQDEELLLFRAVTEFVEALSAHAPVAVLLDDLHWADTSTLKLLLYLARHTRSLPVLLLGTYRDSESGQLPLRSALHDLDREGLLDHIAVKRLDQSETRDLIAELLGESEISKEFVALVHGRTEGNPFFVEQVLRVLVERGDVFWHEGGWDRKSVVEIDDVPESIRAAVGRRLSRLPDEVQDMLRAASVLGQAFQFDDLLAMTELDEVDQESHLEKAISAGLLQTTDGESYTFDHALTQQTLYSHLTARRRRRLHAAAAAAIERLAEQRKERRIAELAWHLLQANELERALPHTLHAGDAARQLFAWSEAEKQYRTTADLAHELGDAATEGIACHKLGDVLLSVGRFEEAVEALERAAHAYHRVANIEAEVVAVVEVAMSNYHRGALSASVARLRRLLDAHADEMASPALEVAAALLDFQDIWLHTPDKMTVRYELLSAAQRLVCHGERMQSKRLLPCSLVTRGARLRECDRPEEGWRDMEAGLALSDTVGDLWTILFCAIVVGEQYMFSGQWNRARDFLERSHTAAVRMHNVPEATYIQAHIGWVLTNLGELGEARRQLEEAVATVRTTRVTTFSPHPYIRLADLCITEGKWDEAQGLLEEAGCTIAAIDDPQWTATLDEVQQRLDSARAQGHAVRPHATRWKTG